MTYARLFGTYLVDEGGVKLVEGLPGQALMSRAQDVDRLIEACFSGGAKAALLYAATLTV